MPDPMPDKPIRCKWISDEDIAEFAAVAQSAVDSQREHAEMRENEYKPWLERGETELAYCKRRSLELSAENGRLEAVKKLQP